MPDSPLRSGAGDGSGGSSTSSSSGREPGSTRTGSSSSSSSSSSSGSSSSSPTVRERVSSTIDSVRDRPGGSVAAAGLGVAAIPEPTPATETAGLAVAGTALGVGAGIEAARQSEVSVPDSLRGTPSEIDAPTQPRFQSEIGVPAGDVTRTEIDRPTRSQRRQSEISVPADRSAPSEVSVPTVDAAQQVGIGQERPGQRREDEEFIIGRETIEDRERTSDLEEGERMRQIREELERRQEFVRDDGETFDETRDPVRFPADEGATGTAADLREQLRPDFDVTPEQSLGVGVGGSGLRDEFLAGVEEDQRQTTTSQTRGGIGQEPITPGFEPAQTPTAPETDTDVGGTTDTGADTGVGADTGSATSETTATAVEASLSIGTQQSQALAQQQTDAVSDQFAQPEQTAFEQQFSEPTQVGQQTGQGRTQRDRPRVPFGDGDSEESDPFAFETDDETFGTGFLSGGEAVEDLFGR